MFESLLAPWRAKFRLAISATACYAIAGVAGAVAFGFGLGALYSWLAQLFSPIIACLIIAGAFLVIAIIPILIYGAKQRAEQKRVAETVAKARATYPDNAEIPYLAGWIAYAMIVLGLLFFIPVVMSIGRRPGSRFYPHARNAYIGWGVSCYLLGAALATQVAQIAAGPGAH